MEKEAQGGGAGAADQTRMRGGLEGSTRTHIVWCKGEVGRKEWQQSHSDRTKDQGREKGGRVRSQSLAAG